MSAPTSAAAPQAAAPTAARFLRNVVIKAVLLFAVVDVLVVLVNPLPVLGRISAYNTLLPGRLRLPYGDAPDQDYNLSLYNLDAMFASHEVARPKAADEYRVLVVGDSSVWGFILPARETVVAQLNSDGLMTTSGKHVRFYNLGYPLTSLAKDVLFLSYEQNYHPDLILWLVTLDGFSPATDFASPLVENNPGPMRALIDRYHLSINPNDPHFVNPSFWDRTLIGRRRDLADLLRLQLYGVLWAATGVDRNIPATYTPRSVNLAADSTFQGLQPPHLFASDLHFDLLKAGMAEAGPVPVLIVNEPTFVSNGLNSDIRYNFYYPRWAYDDYRQLLAAEAKSNSWPYIDLWDAVGNGEFTDSPIHLSAVGEARLAAHLTGPVLALANGKLAKAQIP